MENQTEFTAQEIINKFQELNIDVEELAHDNIDSYILRENNLEYEKVMKKGGEGKGDEWFAVKYFPKHDVYLKIDGWYSSYEGTSFEGYSSSVTEVKPVQKMITVYE